MMSINMNLNYVKNAANVMVGVIFLGLLVAGCSDRPAEVAAPAVPAAPAAEASLCANPDTPMKVFASKFDPATKQGWLVNGPDFAGQNKDVPMGRFDNQIVVELAVPAGVSAARVKLPVSATVPTAAVILDTIWYSGAKEVGRGSPNIELGKTPGNAVNTMQAVAAGADRLMLIARPYREIDGIVTVAEGELTWCKK
jgi:hypothetical protein